MEHMEFEYLVFTSKPWARCVGRGGLRSTQRVRVTRGNGSGRSCSGAAAADGVAASVLCGGGLAPAHDQRLGPTSGRSAPTAGELITCGDRPMSRRAASCSACD